MDRKGEFKYHIDKDMKKVSGRGNTKVTLYSGTYIDKCTNDDIYLKRAGPVRDTKIPCSILEVQDENHAVLQRCRAQRVGRGAANILFVDRKCVIMEKITPLSQWYSQNWESSDLKKHLITMLRPIMKSLANWYTSIHPACFGVGERWTESIGVNMNGEGRLYNFHCQETRYDQELYVLFKLIDAMWIHMLSKTFDELTFSGEEKDIEKDKFRNFTDEDFRLRYKDDLFSNFILNLRSIVKNMKLERVPFFAPIYHFLFWSSHERLLFMETLHDFIWGGRRMQLKMLIHPHYNIKWKWQVLVRKYTRLSQLFDGVDIIDMPSPDYATFGYDSIRYWRNCRCHFNDGLDKKDVKWWHALEIEKELDQLQICGNSFFAYSSYILNTKTSDIYFRISVQRLSKMKAIAEDICKA